MVNSGHINPVINVLLCGSTDISRLNTVSSAGKDPESTFLTPCVDAEIIGEGVVLSMDDPPMTPDGIPSPSIIAHAALNALDIPSLIVNAGLRFKPKTTFMETGLEPAKSGNVDYALPQMKSALNTGKNIFNFLRKYNEPIMISESIPGGTTTAQMVMNLWGKHFISSSSMKNNPSNLKTKICDQAVELHGIQSDPIKAIGAGGDYMQAIVLSMLSMVEDQTVYLAGGTQMAVLWYIASELGYNMDSVYLCTTDLVMKGSGSEIMSIVDRDHLFISHLNYSLSKYRGIRLYSDDNVREGAGLGGSTYFALQNMGEKTLIEHIDENYGKFLHK